MNLIIIITYCFSVAGYSSVIYAYVGEFNTMKYRASMISWLCIAIGISTALMPRKYLYQLKNFSFSFILKKTI